MPFGAGSCLTDEQTGIRALLTPPIDADAVAFFQRFGFVPPLLREGQVLVLLKDARRVLLGFADRARPSPMKSTSLSQTPTAGRASGDWGGIFHTDIERLRPPGILELSSVSE
jgi:hypothetical protein